MLVVWRDSGCRVGLDDKFDLMCVASAHHLTLINTQGIHTGDICSQPNNNVKYIAVILHQCPQMEDHLKSTVEGNGKLDTGR